MKDGYYLSAYVEISKYRNLYASSIRHDQNIALWKKEDDHVELIHYWELERESGIKQHFIAFYNKEQCENYLNQLLSEYDLTLNDMVEIWGLPELNEDDSYLSKYRYPDYSYHSICHLSSALFMDMDLYRNEKILSLVVDAGSDWVVDNYLTDLKEKTEGERYHFMACYSQGNQKELEMFPIISAGLLWRLSVLYFGMREGSLMALASASKSEVWMDVKELQLDDIKNYYNYIYEYIGELVSQINALTKADEGVKFNYFDPRFSEEENKISMVMKIIQEKSYAILDHVIETAIEKYGIKTEETCLAMSGGFALNCPSNTYLMKKYHFKRFIAPPCVSDSGLALGIGLYSFYSKTNGDFSFKFKNAYYGDHDDSKRIFEGHEFDHFIESITEFDANQVVTDLEEGPCVWFDGGAEVGPRALGARSLIGDPRKTATKDRLNEIKLRQWWRPVAPIILKEHISEWFEEEFESPYMLHAVKIREEKREQIPAILHEDNSARFQSICKEDGQERLYEVIQTFYKKTGVPIICNTSLNDKGEPIINRMEEALNFALRKGISVVYLNGKRVVLKNHSEYPLDKPLSRPLQIFPYKTSEERNAFIKEIGFDGFKEEYIHYALTFGVALREVLYKEKNPKKWYTLVKLYFNNEDAARRERWHSKYNNSKAALDAFVKKS